VITAESLPFSGASQDRSLALSGESEQRSTTQSDRLKHRPFEAPGAAARERRAPTGRRKQQRVSRLAACGARREVEA